MPRPYVASSGRSCSPMSATISSSEWFRCCRKTRVTPSASSSASLLGDLLDGPGKPGSAALLERLVRRSTSPPRTERKAPTRSTASARFEPTKQAVITEKPRVAGSRPASRHGSIQALPSPAQLLVRRAEGVDLVGETRGERCEARLDRAAEDERRVGSLNGTRQRALLAELERLPGMVEGVLGPRPDDDLDLLGEELEPLLRIEERKPVLEVLALVPARTHPDVDATAGDVIDGDGHPREHARVAERRR